MKKRSNVEVNITLRTDTRIIITSLYYYTLVVVNIKNGRRKKNHRARLKTNKIQN